MPSILQQIQEAIKNRNQIPLETGMGAPTYMQGGRVSLPDSRAVQTPSPFRPIVPAQEPDQQPTVPMDDGEWGPHKGFVKPVAQPAGPAKPNPMLPPSLPDPPPPSISPDQPVDIQQRALSQVGTPPPAMTWNPIRTKSSGEPEISPTARGDRLGMLEQERNALERWKPTHHRGFKQIVKEGLEGAAAVGAANPNNPWAMLGGAGAGATSGAVQPNVVNKAFQIQKTDAQIAGALKEQQAKAQAAAMQYRPIYQQQQVALGQGRLDQSRRRNDAYISHLDDLPGEKQAEAARKMWMAGVADGNDELKAELARRMGLKESLPDTDKGTVQVDAQGHYTIVHGRTGQAKPVTETTTTSEGQTTQTPVTSIKKTEMDQRQTQFEAREKRIKDVAALSRSAAMERAKVLAGATASRLGDPDELGTLADKLDDEAATADATGTKSGRAEAGKLKDMSTRLREQASKARRGQSAIPSTQSAPALKGRTITQANFDKYKQDHGDKAAQDLLDSGVTIRK